MASNKKMSESAILSWQNPEIRARRLAALSKAMKGGIPWNKGKKGYSIPSRRGVSWGKHTEQTKTIIGQASKEHWEDPEYRSAWSASNVGKKHNWSEESRCKVGELMRIKRNNDPRFENCGQLGYKASASSNKPNRPEKGFIKLCEENNWPFRYVGDGSLWIAKKNPDFVHKSKNVIVEIFGEYWHKSEDEAIKSKIFRKAGFETVVIWSKELNDANLVRSKIESFL